MTDTEKLMLEKLDKVHSRINEVIKTQGTMNNEIAVIKTILKGSIKRVKDLEDKPDKNKKFWIPTLIAFSALIAAIVIPIMIGG